MRFVANIVSSISRAARNVFLRCIVALQQILGITYFSLALLRVVVLLYS